MKFLFSTIGKKIQIAISGILLSIFLLFHLFNNLILFLGDESFNGMVQFLKSIHIIIRIMEFGLLAIILLHIINAILITIQNKKSNKHAYAMQSKPVTAPLNSRTMLFSGIVILLFFIFHLRYFWYSFQNMEITDNFFNTVLRTDFGYLGHLPTAIFYITAILLIAFHLRHGFLSAFKTFGISSYYREGILKYISFLFWGIIPGVFILIIIAIQTGYIHVRI